MSRQYGAADGAALVITSVVGAGIFTVPSYVAALGGSFPVVLALWIGGGLMAMAGALSYAELAARLPRGGAEYVYLREAFGPAAGFLSGWTSFVAGFSGAIAAAAVGFAQHLPQLVPQAAVIPSSVMAIALITLFTVVSVAGVSAGRLATNGLAVMIVIGILAVALGGLAGPGAAGAAATAPNVSAMSALVPIFFTYSGWNAAAYMAGDFRNPARDVPRALVGGTLVVIVLYVALNAAVMRALPLDALVRSPAPVSQAARAAMGPGGSGVVGMLVLAALASSVCALIITGARIYTEMARDGALPAWFARTGKDRVPVTATVAQSLWSSVLVLTGTFEQIVTFTGFSIMLFSGAAVAGLFILRRRHGVPAGYRVPAYPFVPLAFIVTAIAIAVASFRYAPGPSLAGVGLMGVGYLVFRLRRSPAIALCISFADATLLRRARTRAARP